jgi:hypothetical protein
MKKLLKIQNKKVTIIVDSSDTLIGWYSDITNDRLPCDSSIVIMSTSAEEIKRNDYIQDFIKNSLPKKVFELDAGTKLHVYMYEDGTVDYLEIVEEIDSGEFFGDKKIKD